MALVTGMMGLILAATVTGLWLPPRQTSDVAVPAPDATPEQVVTAYLAAVDAHDCDTAEALMVDRADGGTTSWCEDVARLTAVDVRDHHGDVGARARRWGGDVVDVPATFTLDWRLFHGDGSLEEGTTTWGYVLARDSADSPWRIVDQGVG